jgi:competence protein ComEA
MGRSFWLSLLALVAVGAGLLLRFRAPTTSAVPCVSGDLHVRDGGGGQGVVVCGPGAQLPSAWARAVGQKQDLNVMSEEELSQVPGIGKKLARVLISVRTERHGFGSWEDVDAVPGVGPAKLQLLKQVADIHP